MQNPQVKPSESFPRTTSTAKPKSGVSEQVSCRQRFINALHCRAVDRPPVWLMRQAGRALPEYRALKQKHSFLELVQTPELAAEVTLQPVRRFGFDAAILFSDILVVPEAMGQPYRFRETGGIAMEFAVRTSADVARLSIDRVTEKLSYVDKALRLLRKELGDETALIGFAGSPWTLATFMMEGGSAEKYTRALALFREDRKTFNALIEKLTGAVTAYLQMQIEAGVDALQIFDSHGGHLAANEFQEASGRWMREIVAQTSKSAVSRVSNPQAAESRTRSRLEIGDTAGLETCATPIIVFSLGTHGNWNDLAATGANAIGVDWQFSLQRAREILPPTVAIQGNLAPVMLSDVPPEAVVRETKKLLEIMRDRPGYIFNLGHGVTPDAKLENIQALVDTVKDCK